MSSSALMNTNVFALSISLQFIINIQSVLGCLPNQYNPSQYPSSQLKWKKSLDSWMDSALSGRIVSSNLKGCSCGKTLISSKEHSLPHNSTPAISNEFPWQALIRVESESGEAANIHSDPVSHHYCGGTVINDLFILTSSRCVLQFSPGNGLVLSTNETGRKIPPNKIKIWIGLSERKFLVEADGLDVQKIIHPPEFPKQSPIDIAMLKLKFRLIFCNDTTVRPICLPSSVDMEKISYKPHSEVVGWFSSGTTGIENESRLMRVDTHTVICPKYEPGSMESLNYHFYFCSPRYNEHDPKLLNNMDTGSPLTVETRNNIKFQLGILSWISNIDIIDTISSLIILTKSLRLFTRLTSPEILSFIDYISEVEGASWCEHKATNNIHTSTSSTTATIIISNGTVKRNWTDFTSPPRNWTSTTSPTPNRTENNWLPSNWTGSTSPSRNRRGNNLPPSNWTSTSSPTRNSTENWHSSNWTGTTPPTRNWTDFTSPTSNWTGTTSLSRNWTDFTSPTSNWTGTTSQSDVETKWSPSNWTGTTSQSDIETDWPPSSWTDTTRPSRNWMETNWTTTTLPLQNETEINWPPSTLTDTTPPAQNLTGFTPPAQNLTRTSQPTRNRTENNWSPSNWTVTTLPSRNGTDTPSTVPNRTETNWSTSERASTTLSPSNSADNTSPTQNRTEANWSTSKRAGTTLSPSNSADNTSPPQNRTETNWPTSKETGTTLSPSNSSDNTSPTQNRTEANQPSSTWIGTPPPSRNWTGTIPPSRNWTDSTWFPHKWTDSTTLPLQNWTGYISPSRNLTKSSRPPRNWTDSAWSPLHWVAPRLKANDTIEEIGFQVPRSNHLAAISRKPNKIEEVSQINPTIRRNSILSAENINFESWSKTSSLTRIEKPTSEKRTIDSRCNCGHRDLNLTNKSRVFFGPSNALPYEFPWQVLLIIQPKESNIKSYCSGTVINSLFVLTSGNCVTKISLDDSVSPYSLSEVKVKALVYTKEDDSTAKNLDIDKIIVHPRYLIRENPFLENPSDYDIALIKLKNHILFGQDDNIRPVCIPETKDNFNFDQETVSKFVGWKFTNISQHPLVLRSMLVLLYKNDVCKMMSAGGSAQRFLCGKGPAEDINSFSGGFLSVKMKSSNVLLQVGVISHKKTIRVKQKDFVIGYYSSVISYLPFIDHESQNAGAIWCKRDSAFPQKSLKSPNVQARNLERNGSSFQGQRVVLRKRWIWETGSSKNKVVIRGSNNEARLKFCSCGRKGTTTSIKKRHQAAHFEFPWHAHLTIPLEENLESYSCSASIINNIVLITSANCVIREDGNIVNASLVTAELLAVGEFWKGPKVFIDKIMIHPGYMKNLKSPGLGIVTKFDIALLKLKSPIEFKRKHYRPVCLPEFGEEIQLKSGTACLSLAWNKVNTIENKVTHRLLKDEVILHDSRHCDVHFNSSSRTRCANYTNSKMKPLEEDYGKGLYLPSAKSSHMMQIGISSFRVSDNIRRSSIELEYFTKIEGLVTFINYYSNEWDAAWCQRRFTFE